MKKFLFLLVATVWVLGCEDVIDIDLDQAAPRLVIDARLELLEDGDSQNTVQLTRSSGFFEEVNPLVTNALVEVREPSGTVHEFLYNPETALYENTTLVIQDGIAYQLEVTDGTDVYTATQSLVTTVPLTDPEQEELEGFGDITQVTTYYVDPSEPGNYYLFTYEDPNNFRVDVNDDEFINGNRSPNVFFVEDLEADTPITLTITGIDRQAFRFFETLIQQTDDGGGGPFDTQPATVRGNIINERNPERFPFGYFRVSQVYSLAYTSQ